MYFSRSRVRRTFIILCFGFVIFTLLFKIFISDINLIIINERKPQMSKWFLITFERTGLFSQGFDQ